MFARTMKWHSGGAQVDRSRLKRWPGGRRSVPSTGGRSCPGKGRTGGRLLPVLLLAVLLVLGAAALRPGLRDIHLARIESELARGGSEWSRAPLEGWQAQGVECWYLSGVRRPPEAMERRRSEYGYLSVREPVERVGEEESRAAAMRFVPVPLLDEFSLDGPAGYQSVLRGESLDRRGYPLRWLAEEGQAPGAGCMRPRTGGAADGERERPYAYVREAAGLGAKGPVLQHLSLVESAARAWHVPASVLLAVMQVESRGQEDLVSSRNAVGLMQVLPEGGGEEVDRHLAKRGETPAGESLATALFSPEANVAYGACYLHLLRRNYFAGITDSEARMLCVLTAYNIGPGRFLRLFDEDEETAAARINAYTARGLYEEIRERAGEEGPYTYLDKVVTLMRQYRSMGY